MVSPIRRPRILFCLLAAATTTLAAATTTLAAAATREVDTRRFPRLVRIFLLPEEAAVLKNLKDEKDRVLFQQIFWARRDPSPGTPANEFEDRLRAVWKSADDLFSASNQKGSETGCGQVLALLGRPEEVLAKGDVPRQPTVHVGGVAAIERGPDQPLAPRPGQFDDMAYLREGPTREPETWVYRDRPALPYTFTGAELRIPFDPECRYAEDAGIMGADLRRAAAAFVTRPDIAYEPGSGGHLVLPIAGAVAGTSPAMAGAAALLASPRKDFPLALEPKLSMRGPKGEAYVAGLVQASAGASGAPVRFSVAAQATDASGQPTATSAHEVTASAQADGSLVASWGLSLKPGLYKVTVGAQLPDRGSVATIDLEVPDFGGAALVASPLVLYADEPDAAGPVNPRDPYAAMQLGTRRLHPRFGNVFAPSDALRVVATFYGGKVDAATGQAALRSRYSIATKSGKPVARGAEDAFATADAVASVGPIPLSAYAPGEYVVRLDITDKVSGQTLRQQAPFEIRQP
jgi:GWxTD domain-containing protein